MKYWWCIFDDVPCVSGTQLRLNECISVEVYTPSAQNSGHRLRKSRMFPLGFLMSP